MGVKLTTWQGREMFHTQQYLHEHPNSFFPFFLLQSMRFPCLVNFFGLWEKEVEDACLPQKPKQQQNQTSLKSTTLVLAPCLLHMFIFYLFLFFSCSLYYTHVETNLLPRRFYNRFRQDFAGDLMTT
jgi:hypothetical protein